MNPYPNPGSDEAIAQGCRCPVIDNHHGWGYWSKDVFSINLSCPLHGTAAREAAELEGQDA